MAKTILLARPHPFIVEEMRPLLESSGFQVSKPGQVDELDKLARTAAGAVISLAVASPIAMTPEDVLRALRQVSPRMPVLFASLLSFDQVTTALGRLADKAGIANATFHGLAQAATLDPVTLRKEQTFLYLSRDDLADAAARDSVGALLKRFFA